MQYYILVSMQTSGGNGGSERLGGYEHVEIWRGREGAAAGGVG